MTTKVTEHKKWKVTTSKILVFLLSFCALFRCTRLFELSVCYFSLLAPGILGYSEAADLPFLDARKSSPQN